MKYHYVWLSWSSAFLVPWGALYLVDRAHRPMMWRTSLATAPLGLAEPIYVPAYWNPPSLFDLARRTGFDIESLIFAFAIGGIGAVLYNALQRRELIVLGASERRRPLHRFHRAALLLPFILFLPLYLLPWNPIYPSILCLVIGAAASVLCRPDLKGKTVVGGASFLSLYAVFLFGLKWSAPGYIEGVWNLRALSGGLIYGVPLEELLFGFTFGSYWAGAYEHFSWHASLPPAREAIAP